MEKNPAAWILSGDGKAHVPRSMKPVMGTSYFLSALVFDTEKKETYGSWSKLPDLAIEKVCDRLDFIEKFRFASVCVQWRSASPEFARHRPQRRIPWLLFSIDIQTPGAFNFFNLSESMMHVVRLPQIKMNLCCGSAEGWLFMFANEWDNHCFLLNPFRKAIIQLPPFRIEPPLAVLKVILSSSPDIDEDWMVVAHTATGQLLFCKSGDRSWSIGPPRSKFAFSFDDGEIIFCGGHVYALGMLNSVWFFDMETQKYALLGGGVNPSFDLHHNEDLIDDRCDGYIRYFIESNGELFLVARFFKKTRKNITIFDNDLPESIECHTTLEFLLYKLMKNDNKDLRKEYVWVKQSSFGADQALFLSTMGSKSVSTIETPGIHGNSIYFTNDLHPHTGLPCDIGIYHFEDGRTETLMAFDSYYFEFPSVWVTPSVSGAIASLPCALSPPLPLSVFPHSKKASFLQV